MNYTNLYVAALILFTNALYAEVRSVNLSAEGNDLANIAQLASEKAVDSPARLLARIEKIASERPERRHAARALKVLVLAEYGQENKLTRVTEEVRSSVSLGSPWWVESFKAINNGAVEDDERRSSLFVGKAEVILEVYYGGKPFHGQLFWESEGNPDDGGRIPVREGLAGPLLLYPGTGTFSSLIGGRRINFGTVELSGWSSVNIELAAVEANILRLLIPSKNDQVVRAASPAFRWSYGLRPGERIEVSVAKEVSKNSWFTIWGPVTADGGEISFGAKVEPHEPLQSGARYELVVTVIAPADSRAGPAAVPERRSRARSFIYRADKNPGQKD